MARTAVTRKGKRAAKRDTPPETAPREARRSRSLGLVSLAGAVLVAAGIWAYSTSFAGVFVLDDVRAIVLNGTIRTLSPLSTPLSPPRASTVSGRPVANLSFAINYAMAPSDARDAFTPRAADGSSDAARFLRNLWGYHALNLVIHLLAALLLMGIVRRTLESPRLSSRFSSRAPWLAFAVAAIWLVHPLQTEAVTYIVQRVESLASLFYLATMYCAIRAASPELKFGAYGARIGTSDNTPRRSTNWFWSIAAVCSCALGMATKEITVTAPIMVWLWDWTFMAATGHAAPSSARAPHRGCRDGDPASADLRVGLRDMPGRARPARWPLYVGLCATWIILVALLVNEHRAPSLGLAEATVWRYFITQAAVVVHYLRLAFVPSPLVFLYTWPLAGSIAEVAPQAILAVALVALSLAGVARRHPLGFVGAWFFVILAPTSTVLPIITEVAAEHRMYLPLAAVVACVVIAIDFVVQRRFAFRLQPSAFRGSPVTLLVFTAILVVPLGLLTRARNEQYASAETLWADTVSKQPENERARVAYGVVLQEAGRPADAEAQLRAAVRLEPNDPFAHARLGAVLAAAGDMDGAIAELERAVTLRPDDGPAHAILGNAYAARRQDALAAAHLEQARRSAPDDPRLLAQLAAILADSREPAVRNGERAIALAERAAAITGRQDPMILNILSVAQASIDRYADAVQTVEEALALARAQRIAPLVEQLEYRRSVYQARLR